MSVLLSDPAVSLDAREGEMPTHTETLSDTLTHSQPEAHTHAHTHSQSHTETHIPAHTLTETVAVAVTDPRASLSPERVHYQQVHALRVEQLRRGLDTRSLTDTQWGLVPLDKCHHVSTTSSSTASAAPSPAHAHTHSLTHTHSLSQTHTHTQSQSTSPSAHTVPVAVANTASSPVSGPDTHTGTHTGTHTQQTTATERETVGEPPMHTPISSPSVTRVLQSLSPGVLSGGTSTTTSYRVRICKTCCGEANHVELGTYLDQESALLVNDVHELLHARTQRLHLLCAQDLSLGREGERDLLRTLRARKHDRLSRASVSAGKEGQSILDILADRLPPAHNAHTHTSSNNNKANNNENNNTTEATTASPETSRKRKATTVGVFGAHTLSENSRHIRSPFGKSNSSQHTGDIAESRGSAELPNDSNNGGVAESSSGVRFHPDTIGSSQHSHTTHSQAFKRQRSFTFSTAADFAPQSFFAPSAPLSAASVERGGALAWLAEIASEEADCVQTLYALRQASTPSELLLPPRFSSQNTQTPVADTHSNGAEECVSIAEAKEEDDKVEEEEEGVSAQLLAMADYFSPDATERKHVDPYQTNWLSFCGASSSNGSFVAPSAMDPLSLLTSSALAFSAQTQQHMHTRSLTQSLLHTAETQQETRTQLSSSSASVRTHGHTGSHELPAARRGRSNSMSVIESSLGSFGSSRAKDPLSIALRKYIERGGPGDGFIGIYSPEDRRARLQRFQEKRKHRLWTKKVKYDVRKNFADSRIRIKGRFVKKDEEQAVLSLVMRSTDSAAGNGGALNSNASGAGLGEGEEEDEEEGEGEEDEDRETVSSSSSSSKRRSQASSKSATQAAVTQSSARRSRASSLGSATTSVRKKRSASFSSTNGSARKGSAKQQ